MQKLLILPLFIFPIFMFAQVTGTVFDERGEPLPFATVYVQNSSNGTVANANGNYRLQVPRGEQFIVFQYIGYRQRVEKITVGDRPVQLSVRLEAADLQLGEVVITTEDPANRIMREVIAKRSFYKNKLPRYACDVYIKGFHKLLDAPKKVFGQDVGNMGGVLDTNRAGVIYLSESVSKVYYQRQPAGRKEVMVSSKVSGNENGFSINRAALTDFNLYEERLDIMREILSPLADNAFNYYSFKWLGSYKDENGYSIDKIQVIPKRPADPTFSGHLYVVDAWWNLAGADLALTGASIKQPVLDTLRFQQQYVPLEKPDTWGLLTQVTSFKFGVLGFKVQGFFNGVFSNYNLQPDFGDDFFTQETFKIETTASEKDTAYWANIRPVPLTTEERSDYVKKDSLQKIWKSKAYLDSIDHENNRFKISNLLFGYDWENSYRRVSVSYPAAFRWVQFNTVQGWLLDVQPKWQRESDERGTRFWRVDGRLNYGFAEQKLRASARVQRRFESIRYSTLTLEGGTATEQFNARQPIGPLVNSLYSLFATRNYLKIYGKTFARAEWSQVVRPGLVLRPSLEWARRARLANNTAFSWDKDSGRVYATNDPAAPLDFGATQIFVLALDARLRFRTTYSTYPKFRTYQSADLPELNFRYRKALPLADGYADFDFLQIQLRQEDLSWGLAGYTEWNLSGGLFLRRKQLGFMDLYHPMGNQTVFGNPENYVRGFFLLPYYAYATDRPFADLHAQHHLEGWLLDKIPGLRKLNWKEVFGASFYYTERASGDPRFAQKLPYWELNAGFENIGIRAFRPLRVDVAFGFFGKKHFNTGIVVGVGL
jgi:hypothetical protein